MNRPPTHTHLLPRCYGLKELAALYFPNITPRSASTRLKKWIMTTPKLLERLEETNYKPTARILTPRQVTLILDEFGEP